MNQALWTVVLFGSFALALLLAWQMGRAGLRADLREQEAELQRRRFSVPQAGPVNGTGVECGPLRDAVADLAALPRSPQSPAGVVDPRPTAPVGLHPRRVTVHG